MEEHRTVKDRRFLCRCDCGRERTAQLNHLVSGRIKSCGCWARDFNTIDKRTHGETAGANNRNRTPEYRCWRHMKHRCENQNDQSYADYGGRGIAVCEEWRASFETFLNDMGRRPSDDHSIERIDNNGPYRPSNCRWAVRGEQAKNKRSNHRVTHEGVTLTLGEWAKRAGIKQQTLSRRLGSMGWSPERALTQPIR